MSRIRSRLARLEKRAGQRPACPCQDPFSGPVTFIVKPPRVIGRPYVEEPPAPPRVCDLCGRTIKDMHFVVRAPRAIAAGEPT